MTSSDNEPSNQIFKKLRASKDVSDDSKNNVAGHDDSNARTPLRSFGTASATDKVSEQANFSRQKEELQKLSCGNAEMTEFVHTQPAIIQEASKYTAAIQPHSLSSNVPVGRTPQMNNYWNTVSNETSAMQSPLLGNVDQTVIARVLSKHDNHAPLQALSNRNSSQFDRSKQATNMSTQVSKITLFVEKNLFNIKNYMDMKTQIGGKHLLRT